MKREILCGDCGLLALKRAKETPAVAPEMMSHVIGHAKTNYLCDHCNAQIGITESCVARSIWLEGGANPYWPWESEFITISEVKVEGPNVE